jgi:hypothetical protein
LATKKADGLKKQRIGSVMQAIEKIPPSASTSKIAPTISAEAAAEANMSAEAASATEAANLEVTLSEIDELILGMPTEETATAAEQVMVPVPDKGKKIAKAASEEKDFELQNLIGQELSRPKRRSYRNTTFLVATSQEPCSLAGLMKRPWDAFATVPGRR